MTHVPREVDARLVNETVPFLRLLAWLWPSEALYIRRNAIPQLLGNLVGIVRSSIIFKHSCTNRRIKTSQRGTTI